MRKNFIVIGILLAAIFVLINLLMSNSLGLDFAKSCSQWLGNSCPERQEQLTLVSYGFLIVGILFVAYGIVAGIFGKPKTVVREVIYVQCQNCGAKNFRDAEFCSNCGSRMRPAPIAPAKDTLVLRCLVCGKENPKKAEYCSMCGARLVPPETELQKPPARSTPSAPPPKAPPAMTPIPSAPPPEEQHRQQHYEPEESSLGSHGQTAQPAQAKEEKQEQEKPPQIVICVRCNAENLSTAEFCANCGAQMRSPLEQPPNQPTSSE